MKKQLSHVVGAAVLAAGVAVVPGVVSPQPAAAMTVYDPSNHAENLASKLQLIKQYEKQLQQYETQLKQLAKLDPSQLSESVRQVQEVVAEMNNIRTSINAIGTDFKQAQQQFDETFADFSKWNGASARDYADQTDKVNAAVESGIRRMVDQLEEIPTPAWLAFKADTRLGSGKPTTGKLIYAVRDVVLRQKSKAAPPTRP